MQNNPQMTLNRLIKYSTTENPKFKKLYSCLYSVEFYKLAYQNIHRKPSQMTPATDGSTIDGMSEERINKLIQSLRDGSYIPTDLRRINIPKKSGGTRPISIPSFNDKLVQEIIRMVLEAIYEKTFSDCSHAFRPNRSCHTALDQLRTKFQSSAWYIEGDITDCFGSINHHILLSVLRERITDLKFIHLINLFLKSGYLENWTYHKTYSGVPQGTIIGPILANIYLDKFDKYMNNKIEEYNCGKSRKISEEYMRISSRVRQKRYQIKKKKEIGKYSDKDHSDLLEKIREFKKYDGCCTDPMDPNFKRLRYIRYADDFLIGIIGPKKDAIKIKDEIAEWLQKELLLTLSPIKTKITHNSEKVRFLGYDIITVRKSQKKFDNGNIKLSVPHDVMVNYIVGNRFGKWHKSIKSGKDELKPIHRPELTVNDELEILNFYNYKVRGLYNFYSLAENVYKFNSFNEIVKGSFLKTLCSKYKTRRTKLYRNKNYCRGVKVGVTVNGVFKEFFDGPFEKKKPRLNYSDRIVDYKYVNARTSLINRMNAKRCEFCGTEEGNFEVHHVRKLKDLKGKSKWEKLMISRQRKTLILCVNCHDKLHAGKL